MRVVIDAIPVVPFGGFAVTLESLLEGWSQLESDDEIHVLLAEGAELELPASIETHRFRIGRPEFARRALVQSRAARRICQEANADALLAPIPATAIGRVGCPKVITVHDLRHEILPDQFGRARRGLRRAAYAIGYRQADGIICISERTRGDLLRLHPSLEAKPIFTIPWGADHVDSWAAAPGDGEEYALAFGHFPNKAANGVVVAWKLLADRGEARPLVIVGVPDAERERLAVWTRSAGLENVVEVLPWLERDEFRARFAGAGLIVFPSDFEGFGLPAVEAMRLGIPLVISRDEALLEVTGGNATVVEGPGSEAIADAVAAAWTTPRKQLERARAHAAGYSWKGVAEETRAALASVAAGAASPSGP